MESLRETQIRIIKGVSKLIGVLSIVSLIMLVDPKPFITGLVFGAIANVLNFRLLYLTVSKAILMEPHRAQAYTVRKYFIRYIITGGILYLAATREHINILGVLIGLFSIKLVIIKTELFNVSFLKDIFKRKEEI